MSSSSTPAAIDLAAEDKKESKPSSSTVNGNGSTSIGAVATAGGGSTDITVDNHRFWRHVDRIRNHWHHHQSTSWLNVGVIVVILGKDGGENEQAFHKPGLFIQDMFGTLFADTVIAISDESVLIITPVGKRFNILSSNLKSDPSSKNNHRLELLSRSKENYLENSELLFKFIEKALNAKGSSSSSSLGIGSFLKDPPFGPFSDDLINAIKSKFPKAPMIEIALAVSEAVAPKLEDEKELMIWSSTISSKVMQKAFVRSMEEIVDKEKKSSQSVLSDKLEEFLGNPIQKLKMEKLDQSLVENACFTPIIQSGGVYDLNPSALSTEDNLAYDTIICSLGARYGGYCSHVARTYFINPSPLQSKCYHLLLDCQRIIMNALRPGATVASAYNAGREFIESKDKDLVQYFKKDAGWGIGLNFRDAAFVINPKCERKVQEIMTFSVCVGFADVPLPDNEKEKLPTIATGKFSCMLADTIYIKPRILVNDDMPGSAYYDVFTDGAKKEWKDVKYEIKEDDEDEEEEEDNEDNEEVKNGKSSSSAARNNPNIPPEYLPGVSTRSRRNQSNGSSSGMDMDEKKVVDAEIEKHQHERMLRKAKLAKMGADGDHLARRSESNVQIVQAFNNSSAYPKDLKANQIYTDQQNECVFLPIGGYHVPFHITCIKNVSKHDEDKAAFLRINFHFPATSYPKDISPQMKAALDKYPGLAYVKVMTFRSRDARNLNQQLRVIKELQKRVRVKQQDEDDRRDLVEQNALILLQDRTADMRARLDDVNMRPAIGKTKKCTGSLVAHQNGLRFREVRSGLQLDIIYNNIKHFFLQPSKGELMVIIHFELRNPIMIGGKKSKYVQFFTEITEGSTAIDLAAGTRDQDEIEEEARERRLRAKYDKLYKDFSRQTIAIADKFNQRIGSNNEVDTLEYREIGFYGVPYKENVLLQPTLNALVNLSDTPPFVVTLDEIEHVHFERVFLGRSKNFDMVLILKEQMKLDSVSIPIRISAIPMESFESIKRWIDEKDGLTFTYGNTSLNWKVVMQGVRDELERGIFWNDKDEDGEPKDIGWNFLALDSASDDEDDGDEEESSYHESEGDDEEEGGEDEDDDNDDNGDDDDESDFSDNVVDEDEDEEDEEGEDEEDEDEGEDWSDLEENAMKADYEADKRDRERHRPDKGGPSSSSKRKGPAPPPSKQPQKKSRKD